MSRRTMAEGQLLNDLGMHLHPIGDYYICNDFNENVPRPPVIRLGDKIYYRFLNFLYLPQPPESLSNDKIIEVCDLRLEHLNKLVNHDYNSRIISAIADYITSIYTHVNSSTQIIKALDFGCGSGLSTRFILEHFPQLDMVGVDISEKAVQYSNEQGLTAFLTCPDEPLPFEAASFDLVFAVFVMHFKIDIATLSELKRVLHPSGRFVFNLYQRDLDGVQEQLIEAGFSIVEVVKDLYETGIEHKIVSCGALPMSRGF